MGLLALSQADFVAWACFVVGVLTFLGGVGLGYWISFRRTPAKTEEAKTKLDEASANLDKARQHINESMMASGLESTAAAADASTAVNAADDSASAAKSALEQVEGIIGALPENLRFAGLLILVGTALIGVATVQFGGVSLF